MKDLSDFRSSQAVKLVWPSPSVHSYRMKDKQTRVYLYIRYKSFNCSLVIAGCYFQLVGVLKPISTYKVSLKLYIILINLIEAIFCIWPNWYQMLLDFRNASMCLSFIRVKWRDIDGLDIDLSHSQCMYWFLLAGNIHMWFQKLNYSMDDLMNL